MKQILNTLYVQTQGAYIRLDYETLKVEVEKKVKLQIPLHHLGGIFAFGNVLFSPFLIHKCAEDGRNVVWLIYCSVCDRWKVAKCPFCSYADKSRS